MVQKPDECCPTCNRHLLPARVVRKIVVTERGCWEWSGARTRPNAHGPGGYGYIQVRGRKELAHRFMYALIVGPLAADELVRHTCDNPPCVNPAHLLKGTQQSNARDRVERGRHAKRVSRLRASDVAEIRSVPRTRGSGRSLSRRFGISETLVSQIRKGRELNLAT